MRLFNWGAIPPGRVYAHVSRALCFSLCVSASVVQRAEAQTTVVLNVPGSQVIDTTIRNGPYANANQDGAVLLTRSSTVPEWERRTILGFNTSTIPDRTVITSATLTLTLKSGIGHRGCDASGGRPSAGVGVHRNAGDLEQPSDRRRVADARRRSRRAHVVGHA